MLNRKSRKLATRERILVEAARLFSERGFNGASIEDVMHACGLTRGGFYSHFKSKADLHGQSLTHQLRTQVPGASAEFLDACLASCRHDMRGPLSKMAVDAGSERPEVRRGYTEEFRHLCRLLGEADPASLGGAAEAVVALLIGAVAVAHTVDDDGLRMQVAESCREAAHALLQKSDDDMALFWLPNEARTSPSLLH